MLVTSNFSFSHSVFKRLVSQGRQKVSLCGNGLPLTGGDSSYPITTQSRLLTPLEKKALGDVVGKGQEICKVLAFSPFPKGFSILPNTIFNFSITIILSSANALNLDWCKILLFSKELKLPLLTVQIQIKLHSMYSLIFDQHSPLNVPCYTKCLNQP